MHIYNSWTDVEQWTEVNLDIHFTLNTALQRFEETCRLSCVGHTYRLQLYLEVHENTITVQYMLNTVCVGVGMDSS